MSNSFALPSRLNFTRQRSSRGHDSFTTRFIGNPKTGLKLGFQRLKHRGFRASFRHGPPRTAGMRSGSCSETEQHCGRVTACPEVTLSLTVQSSAPGRAFGDAPNVPLKLRRFVPLNALVCTKRLTPELSAIRKLRNYP